MIEPEQSDRVTQYFFYVLRSQAIKHANTTLDEDYSTGLWKPALIKTAPKSPVRVKILFFIWTLFHYLGLFSNSNYSIFAIYFGKQMVHYSVILPKYFRYPFMARSDLQIGPCWTHAGHRRKGIASYAIQEILELYKERDRKFWYIVREKNIASVQLVETAGFTLYGKGVRKKKLCIRFLGVFAVEKEL